MKLETVLFDQDDSIAIIRLNRPKRMNAVIEQMYLDLQIVLDRTRNDSSIRALVLTGSTWKRADGEKQAFCAGADLKAHAAGERSPWQRREYIFLAHETTRLIYEFPKPVIVAVNGPARGAGTEMALNGDFLLMADTATIGFPETGLGTFVGGGLTSILPKLIGLTRAKELIYTGRILDGKAAVDIGLAMKSVPVEQLLPETIAFAKELAEKSPISMAFAKELIRLGSDRDLKTVLLAEAEAILACMNTDDWHEGIASFNEKRKPEFKGR